MDVSISIVETSVKLGDPVTVNYSSTGFDNTQIAADNLSTPLDLGAGDVSGTIKLLPLMDGTFGVTIYGYTGGTNSDGEYYKQNTASASIEVK